MIKFKCQRCKATIQASDANVGRHVQCPTCGLKNVVPRPKERKPIPPVVWAATGLVLSFGVLAWAVWPSSDDNADTSDEKKVKKEEIPDFDLEVRKRLQEDRYLEDERKAKFIDEAKEFEKKRRREEEERLRRLADEERRQREADEAARREQERRERMQRDNERKEDETDPNRNRYE